MKNKTQTAKKPKDQLLCVGGPYSGKYMELEPFERFYHVAMQEPWTLDFPQPQEQEFKQPQAALLIRQIVYERRWWQGSVFYNRMPRCILVPQGQTEEETRALLERLV